MVDQQLLILQHLGASPSPTGAKTRSPGPTPGQHADGRYAQRTPMTMPLYPGWQLAATPGTPPMAGPLELAGAGPTSRSPHVRPVGDHQLAKVDLPGMGLAPAGPLVFVGQEVLVQQPGVSHEGRGTRRARAHVAAVEGAGAGVQTRQQARQSAQSQGQPSHAGNAGVQLQPVAGDQGLPIKGEQCQRQPLPALPPSQQGAGTAGSAEQGRGSARRRAREGQGKAQVVGGVTVVRRTSVSRLCRTMKATDGAWHKVCYAQHVECSSANGFQNAHALCEALIVTILTCRRACAMLCRFR